MSNSLKHRWLIETLAATSSPLARARARQSSAIGTCWVLGVATMAPCGWKRSSALMWSGAQGAPSDGPFDAIVLGGSVCEVPKDLLEQLAIGGRLIAIVGEEPVMRATVITRTGEASFHTAQPWDTVAPRLLNFPQASRFHF